jgi:hypothetical protein
MAARPEPACPERGGRVEGRTVTIFNILKEAG